MLAPVLAECIPNFSCTDWSECNDAGIQTRTCAVVNMCGEPSPEIAKSCLPPNMSPEEPEIEIEQEETAEEIIEPKVIDGAGITGAATVDGSQVTGFTVGGVNLSIDTLAIAAALFIGVGMMAFVGRRPARKKKRKR